MNWDFSNSFFWTYWDFRGVISHFIETNVIPLRNVSDCGRVIVNFWCRLSSAILINWFKSSLKEKIKDGNNYSSFVYFAYTVSITFWLGAPIFTTYRIQQ